MSTNKKKKDNNLSIVITEPTIEKNENKKKRKG